MTSDVLLEATPSGVPEPPRAAERARVCWACTENLTVHPHAPGCPARPVVYRLNVTNDPAMRRFEDGLERATRAAERAWLASGRTLP